MSSGHNNKNVNLQATNHRNMHQGAPEHNKVMSGRYTMRQIERKSKHRRRV